jgi:hypothetical protein
VNESAAITSFLSAPTGGEIQFFSSLYKGLVDCRSATNRDLGTGEKLPTEKHDSWVGALGYLSLLDLIGTCLTRKGSGKEPTEEIMPFIHALETFGGLTREEISVLYALRCAFSLSRSAPYLGFLAQAVGDKLRWVERLGRSGRPAAWLTVMRSLLRNTWQL